jgi:hypothetical protein
MNKQMDDCIYVCFIDKVGPMFGKRICWVTGFDDLSHEYAKELKFLSEETRTEMIKDKENEST